MTKEDIAFRKMAMLFEAVNGASRQEEALDDLRVAAFEVLLLHPGCTYDLWEAILLGQYGTELVDAYGKDMNKIHSSLMELWKRPYLDKSCGLEYDYKTWAEVFATEAAVKMYYDMKKVVKT